MTTYRKHPSTEKWSQSNKKQPHNTQPIKIDVTKTDSVTADKLSQDINKNQQQKHDGECVLTYG